MPRYYPLRSWPDAAERDRVIDRLLALRAQLRREIGASKRPDSLLLATWNIRDFDSNKFGHGPRLDESFHYIAEIIAAFDLVAVQEVNRDLGALERVLTLLGGGWDYIVTDTTEGSGGNEERMAFLYDRCKVSFRNIAGEVVLPKTHRIAAAEDELQFARTPFVVAFRAGWFNFNLCTVHIYYGASSGAKLDRRIEEIRRLARFFARRQEREHEDYILLGDFNIVSPEHRTMQALEGEGFHIPAPLKKARSNLGGDRNYDQIAFRVRQREVEPVASGVLDYRRSVFRNEDYAVYFERMPADKRDIVDRGRNRGKPRSEAGKRRYYRDQWRTWQMSDHLPMWVELKVDFTEDYLRSLQTAPPRLR